MVFTNYFLFACRDFPYYENALSMIPDRTKQVAWDEYFLYKRIVIIIKMNSRMLSLC